METATKETGEEIKGKQRTDIGTFARTIISAGREKRKVGADQVHTGHLLLSFFENPECLAAQALSQLRITREQAEKALLKLPPTPTLKFKKRIVPARKPLAQEFRRIFKFLVQETDKAGVGEPNSAHFLLSFLRDEQCLAGQALRWLGVTYLQAHAILSKLSLETKEE